MLTNSNHALYLHIQNLVQALNNKKASNSAKNELISLIETTGVEAEKYTLSCLFDTIDFKDIKTQGVKKEQLKTQFLLQRLTSCLESPAFLDYFVEVIESQGLKHNIIEYVNDLFKLLKLTVPVQIVIALSLSQSQNPQISKEGTTILKKKLIEYCKGGKEFVFPENILNNLLYALRTYPHFESMKKEITFLVESNSTGKTKDLRPLLSGNTEILEAEAPPLTITEEIPTNLLKIWEIMEDLGPSCTHATESVERILLDYPSLTEKDILEVLLLMGNKTTILEDKDLRAINHTYHATKTNNWSVLLGDNNTKEGNTTWKVNNFLEACNKKYKIDWAAVIAALDKPNLYFTDPQALVFLFKSFQRFKKVPSFRFPSSILFGKWKNFNSQIEFLVNVIHAAQPETVFFTELQKRTVSTEHYLNLKLATLNPPVLQFFASLDILENLIELSESNRFKEVKELFNLPLEKCPDMLLIGLIEIAPRCGVELLNDLLTNLFLQYLSNSSDSARVFEIVYKIKPQLLISAFSEIYNRNQNQIDISIFFNILQATSDSLIKTLNGEHYFFAVSLSFLTSKHNLINLEEWILNRIKTTGDKFVTALLKFLTNSIFEPCKKSINNNLQFFEILEKTQLTTQTLINIFQMLTEQNQEFISHRNKIHISELYKDIEIYLPDIQTKIQPTGADIIAVNLIEKVFEGTTTVIEFIDFLTKYKDSQDEKEKEIAMCIISSLLDESRFFSTYKYKMLMIMAHLYGSLIKNDIIEGKTRDLAFLIIIDTVKQKESRKIFDFGVNALLFFRERLWEWPQKAALLFNIDNLKNYSFELLEHIHYDLSINNVEIEYPEDYLIYANARAAQKNLPNGESAEANSPSLNSQQQPSGDTTNSAANQLSPRQLTLEEIISSFDKEYHEVPEETKTKISTSINSCSEANLFQRALEIKGLLKEDPHIVWFAKFLIAQKAHKESNKHDLFISLAEKIGKKEVFNILIKETYVLFNHVLSYLFSSSEKAVLNGKDKNILKNIGSWLGSLTLARNKPIIMKEFDIKTLIINAHESKKLDCILPLICKILIQGNQSGSVFKPNNAWMNAILSILAEIGEMQDIKMALKYEIQMLFRNLGINDGDIIASKVFQSRKARKKNAQQAQNHGVASFESYLHPDELMKHIKLNITALKNAAPDIDFKLVSAQALSIAIKKTSPNVSDASTLAFITSKRLVLKDFALEPDEKNLLRGLELTIQSLAENLTLVTSKRPLAENFQQALEEFLGKHSIENKEKIIESIIANNLDIGCAIIKNAVVMEALAEASHDVEILQAVEKRKVAREKGSPHFDGTTAQIWTTLPDLLKPNPRGLSKEELKIYEDFGSGSSKKISDDA